MLRKVLRKRERCTRLDSSTGPYHGRLRKERNVEFLLFVLCLIYLNNCNRRGKGKTVIFVNIISINYNQE